MSVRVADAADRIPLLAVLAPEWDRMQALVEIAVSHRAGTLVSEEAMSRLRHASALVKAIRTGGAWRPVETAAGITAAEAPFLYDALALALLPHVRPSTAFGLLTLNHASQGLLAPTSGALYEVLALGGAEDLAFFQALRVFDALAASGLTRVAGDAPLKELHPGTRLAELVFEIGEPIETPPGVLRLAAGPSLEHLVLPDRTHARIADVLAAARFMDALRDRGETPAGPVVLLAGAPGTGKTLAARAMAAALARPLFRVDFGMVVSKWVGETEKNLNRVFDTLHGLRAVLLVDECDALLGKRVAVKDARDQYANTTTGHLLARFERHDGLVFLTSNLAENIDEAYFRRFGHVIGFQRPTEVARRAIWALHIPDVESGPDREAVLSLAAPVKVTGGEIANAAMNARAFAHDEGRPVGPQHLAKAIWQEMTKLPRTVRPDDLGALAEHLPAEVRR